MILSQCDHDVVARAPWNDSRSCSDLIGSRHGSMGRRLIDNVEALTNTRRDLPRSAFSAKQTMEFCHEPGSWMLIKKLERTSKILSFLRFSSGAVSDSLINPWKRPVGENSLRRGERDRPCVGDLEKIMSKKNPCH